MQRTHWAKTLLAASLAIAVTGCGSGIHSANSNSEGSPALTLSATSLSFGSQTVGTSSATQTLTATNTGEVSLTFSSIVLGGSGAAQFPETSTCGASLGAHASCSVTVAFSPSAVGAASAMLTFTDNAADSPQTVALSGTGSAVGAPGASLNPTSLSFGPATLGSTSAAQTVTLTNSGAAALTISSITIGGTNPTSFSETNTCPASLAANANCSISVTFTPGSLGALGASLLVADNVAGSPQSVSLTGTGTAAPVPGAMFNPTSLTFSSTNLGSSSAAQSVMLTNNGTAALNISSISIGGTDPTSFSQTNTCPASLAASASCTFSVTFTPVAAGALSASLLVADNATGSPQSVSLSGTGVGTPTIAFNPTSLTFSSTNLGSSSAAQSVMLTNNGTAALNISSISIGGTNASSFAQTNTCPAALAVSASCTFSVTFTPAAAGALSASLLVADNATGSPQSVSLSGNGVGMPSTMLNPTSLTFSSTNIGSSSSPQSVMLTNNGTAALNISSITIGGTNPTSFSQTNTCPASLAVNASCSISVTFTPTTTGTLTASVLVADNATGSPQSVSLTGTGTGVSTVSFNPTSLTFTSTNLGSSSAAQSVMLTNNGTAALNISSITIGGANASSFSQTNTCPASLAVNANCSISVTFTPATAGTLTASVLVADNATGSPQSVGLTGTGTGVPAVTLNPTSLTFAPAIQGTTSAAQNVSLTNSGTGALTISSISITGTNPTSFAQTNTCPASLAVNASCTISVTFTPATTGALTASVSIADNVAGSPQTVSLNGTGQAAPTITLAPTTLTFGSVALNTTTAAKTVTVTNIGTTSATITSIGITGTGATYFNETNTCGSTLAGGAKCTISVTFSPTVSGAYHPTLSVADDATGSPQTVNINGTGAGPVVSLSPASITFNSTQVGATAGPKTITLTNTGNANLDITSITISGANAAVFSQTNTCPATVAAAGTCTISVTYAPTADETDTASVVVADDASGSPQSASLTGTGTGTPAIKLNPGKLTFTAEPLDMTSASQAITVSTIGTGTLDISSITITGTDSASFAQTNTCPATLSGMQQCIISVTFTPLTVGTLTASVSVADNVTGSPQTVGLTGTGGGPYLTVSPSAINFGSQATGTTSAAQVVTVTNTGTSTATFTSIGITGADVSSYSFTKTCGTTLAVNASCTISVKFLPQALGDLTATLTLTDNALNSQQTVSLDGTGIGSPAVTLSPTSLTFASTAVGSSSAAQTVTLTNSGTATLNISSITISGANESSFSDTTTCTATLAPAAKCTVSVKFSPSADGTLKASLVFNDNAPDTPESVSLTGTGTGAGTPALTITPGSYDFGQVATASSGTKAFTVTNSGTATVTISSITLSGSSTFTKATTCGATLTVGSNCTITVTFSPVVTGTMTGSLVFTDNAANSPQTVALQGEATTGTPTLPTPTQPTLLYGTVVTGTAQPVSGSAVKLYLMKTTGGSGSNPLIASTTSGSDGSFYFYTTGATSFTCPSATTPVYLIATGGTPQGIASANADLAMMTVLGNCGSLTSAVINEVTTVAGVSAMADFISSSTVIDSSTTDAPSLLVAVNNAMTLVDPTTGKMPGPMLPAGATIDTAKINGVADILYTCTYSTGGVAGDGSACSTLFANTTGLPQLQAAIPSETFTAMLNIATFVAPWINGLENSVPTSGQPFAPIWTSNPPDLMPRILPLVAAPVFSPVAGNYTGGTVAITMTSATSGAQIYYTTDGSTPTTASTPYLGTLNLSTTAAVTIKAIAVENVSTPSGVTTGTYFVTGPSLSITPPAAALAASTQASATGTVTLSAPSLTPTTVTLTSGAPNAVSFAATATATTTVTIPVGSLSAPFTVYGLTAGSATITATASNFGQGSAQVRSTMLTATNTVTTAKAPIAGFTSMGYQGFNDGGYPAGSLPSMPDVNQEEINANPNVFTGTVINVMWSQIEPTQGSYDFTTVEENIANIIASNAKYGQHVRAKIRFFANANVPAWLLAQENGGVWVENGTGTYQIDALYWSATYETQFVAVMNALAAEYDTRDIMAEMVGSACASNTDEPLIETQTTIANGYVNPSTGTQNPSMHTLGYTDGRFETCVEHQAQDYAAWKLTDIYTPSAELRLTDTTIPANSSPQYIDRHGYAVEQMQAFFDQLGTHAILANQALNTEAAKESEPDQIPIYTEFPILAAQGAHVAMQTVGQGGLNSVCTNPNTGDDGVCYSQVVAYGIKQSGGEIELWQTTNSAEPNPNGGYGTGNAQISAADILAWDQEYGFMP